MASGAQKLPKAQHAVAVTTAPAGMFPAVEGLCNASTLAQREHALVSLIRWVRGKDTSQSATHLGTLLDYLDADHEARRRLQRSFGQILKEIRCLSLLAEVGVPSDHSLHSELMQQLVGRLLPSAREDTDGSKLLLSLYSSPRTAKWFASLSQASFGRMALLLSVEEANWERQHTDAREALRLLAARVGGIGLEPEVRDRANAEAVSDSAFYQLAGRTEELLHADGTGVAPVLNQWRGVVSGCRREMQEVHRHMESAGVSVELVFDLRKIESCLARMEALVAVLYTQGEEHVVAVHSLLEQLIAGRLADNSLPALLRDNLSLISRKMVERTGRSGEHYIAQTRSEYRHMWLAALGGGLLTVFTAAIKMKIYEAGVPPFVEGFVSGTNYAVSFIILQMLGLVLATKQPAATAATFAGIVRNNLGLERSSKITDFVARITRTQLAAALGNVIAVSAGAVLFESLWARMFAHSYLDPDAAHHVYEMLHPLASATAFYAIITGVILWLAALAGGWCENFAVYYRIDEAVAQHPVGTRVGRERLRSLARLLQRNVGGWSTSIVLGYLLGFTPIVGNFFGLPLDVRHVTLSTGQLALAAARFGTGSFGDRWFYRAVGGIAVIFVLNLTVSFMIAAMVALRAYNVGLKEQVAILKFLCADAVRSPRRFLWPVEDSSMKAPQEPAPSDSAGSSKSV